MKHTAILQQVPFFSDLAEELLDHVAEIGTSKKLEAGAVVFSEGDLPDGLYVILDGRVRIHHEDESGNDIELARLEKGEFFGEMALLDGHPRSATAACLEDCEFLVLGRQDFFDLLRSSDFLLSEILADFSRRVRGTNEKYYWEMLRRQQIRSEMEIERHRFLSQLVAGVAHEINTPLGIVNSAASLIGELFPSQTIESLAQDEDTKFLFEDLQEAIRLIQGNISRANHLIQSFRNLSFQQASEARETTDLPALISEIVDISSIKGKDAALEFDVRNDLDPEDNLWTGYAGSLSQVLLNLITNAQRYAYADQNDGKIEIVISAKTGQSGNEFIITVRDFGSGIPEQDLPQIFEPFFTTGRDKGGTGLGLAIVYNLVKEALGGDISVESELGKGTTFTITLPAVVPEE